MATRFYVYNYVSRQVMGQLRENPDIQYFREQMRQIFGDFIMNLEEQFENNKTLTEIFLDYLCQIYKYSLKHEYSDDKISCLLELGYRLIEKLIQKRMTYNQAFDYFKEILLRHSLFRPPHSINVFPLANIKDITDFFLRTFFRNYQLYMKSFSKNLVVEIKTNETFEVIFPYLLDLGSGQQINKEEVPQLNQYLTENEIKLTDEEIEEIMRGDSIHNISPAKKAQIIKMKLEKDRKDKIDKIMKYELEKLQKQLDDKIKLQDTKFQDILAQTIAKGPKK